MWIYVLIIYGSLICLSIQLSSDAGQTDYIGDEFMAVFPGTTDNVPKLSPDPEIDAWVLSKGGGVVHMLAKDLKGTYKVRVTEPSATKLVLGPSWVDARMTPQTIEEKGVNVTSTSSMLVYVTYGSYNYLAIPSSMLGKDYFVVCSDRNTSSVCFFGIAAIEDNTIVNITLPVRGERANFTLDNVMYGPGDMATIVLSSSQTLEITSDVDLTGTRVQSDGPVIVVSGNIVWTLNDVTDVVQQMVPVSAWGKRFFVVIPDVSSVQMILKIVARNDNTTVVLTYGSKVLQSTLDSSDQSTFEVHLRPSDSLTLECSEPIMAIYYVVPSEQNANHQPSMTTMTPKERYNSHYEVIINKGDDSRFVVVFIADTSQCTGILLDGYRLQGKARAPSWQPLSFGGKESKEVVWTPLGGSSVSSTQVALSNGSAQHESSHVSGGTVSYGMFVYRIKSSTIVDIPLNMRLIPLWDKCVPIPAKADDEIDNDCDGLVDEETKDGIDNDKDGRIDEDFSTDKPYTERMDQEQASSTSANMIDSSEPITSISHNTPKKTRLPRHNTTASFIVGSVLIGVPLLVVGFFAIQAVVFTLLESRHNKVSDNDNSCSKATRPEVIPMFSIVRSGSRQQLVAPSSVDPERCVTPGMVEEPCTTEPATARHVTYIE